MSNIIATVRSIKNVDGLNSILLSFDDYVLEMISLELSDNIQISSKVSIGIKSSNIILSQAIHNDISCKNQIYARIQSIDNGVLLSNISLSINEAVLESMVLSSFVASASLAIGDDIVVMINAQDIFIVEVFA